jgi:peptidoglycan/xylan/chitin deacetylase (PgdA/CDA1 family)
MGTVVISIDAELAGGGTTTKEQDARDFLRANRRRWRRVSELLEEHGIPATWAIVGRLYEENRSSSYPAIDQLSTTGENTGSANRLKRLDERVSGQDLVKLVRDASVDHEIGSHSYSHFRFSDLRTRAAQSDVHACVEAASNMDIQLRSFVYPYNDIAHRGVLKEAKITCYRGRPPSTPGDTIREGILRQIPFHRAVPSIFKRSVNSISTTFSEIVSYSIGGPPPLVRPTMDEHGLVSLPASLPSLFRLSRDYPRVVRALRGSIGCPIVRTAKQGIDKAVDADGIFHFWFHPFDLRAESDFKSLDEILEYLDGRREQGDVDVKTMIEIAVEFEQGARQVEVGEE